MNAWIAWFDFNESEGVDSVLASQWNDSVMFEMRGEQGQVLMRFRLSEDQALGLMALLRDQFPE